MKLGRPISWRKSKDEFLAVNKDIELKFGIINHIKKGTCDWKSLKIGWSRTLISLMYISAKSIKLYHQICTGQIFLTLLTIVWKDMNTDDTPYNGYVKNN